MSPRHATLSRIRGQLDVFIELAAQRARGTAGRT
jgi:hypothetical protein